MSIHTPRVFKHDHIFHEREQETILNTYIDTLAEWWEHAEDAPASPGDRIIERHVCDSDEDTYYTIGTHREGMHGLIGKSGTRILSRAPKPTPAWHDAVAVMALTPGRPELRVFIRDAEPGWWADVDSSHETDELAHVTPLIEAKVTDEMVNRARAHASAYPINGDDLMRAFLTAALGLDPA